MVVEETDEGQKGAVGGFIDSNELSRSRVSRQWTICDNLGPAYGLQEGSFTSFLSPHGSNVRVIARPRGSTQVEPRDLPQRRRGQAQDVLPLPIGRLGDQRLPARRLSDPKEVREIWIDGGSVDRLTV